jgi:hypothetical protein
MSSNLGGTLRPRPRETEAKGLQPFDEQSAGGCYSETARELRVSCSGVISDSCEEALDEGETGSPDDGPNILANRQG